MRYGSNLARVGVPLIIVMVLLAPTLNAIIQFVSFVAPYVVGAVVLCILFRLAMAWLQRW